MGYVAIARSSQGGEALEGRFPQARTGLARLVHTVAPEAYRRADLVSARRWVRDRLGALEGQGDRTPLWRCVCRACLVHVLGSVCR
jgi:hypothetical protein